MQKVVIDTNILVSAFIQKSYPHLILNFLSTNNQVTWCVSDEILLEYADVLRRVKFSKYPGFTSNSERLLADITKITSKYKPNIKLAILQDLTDHKFLELAAACNADFIVTGNIKHFPMDNFGQTKIVTPKDYWELSH